MSDAALRTLRKAVDQGSFAAAYYICGEDDFQKEDAMKKLMAAAIEPEMRDFNTEMRRGSEFDAKSLDAALSALPMMADRRVVVIRDAGSLRKDARKVLDRYLAGPAPDVLVLIVEASGAKTDRELAGTTTLLEFAFLSAGRIPRWISHHVTTELRMKITPDAVELLQSAVGTDLHQLVSELEKLASFSSGGEITEEDVAAVVGVRRGETIADLLDEVALRNGVRALEILPRVLSQPKTTAVLLVMALATQTIALAWGEARRKEGLSQSRLQDEYFALLKQSGSLFTGRPWGSAAAAWAGASDRWSTESLDHALDALLEADVALKESRFSSEEQIVATLILSMCVEDDRSMAA